MEDIAPILLEQIKEMYKQEKNSSEKVKLILEKIKEGKISYIDAGEYADELGKILSDAYGSVFTTETLPDGKMYYNIAKRTVEPTMKDLHSDIADLTDEVQMILNEQAGLGINAIRPTLEQDKIDGILNRLSNAESYDDIAWILAEPIKTFARSVVDDSVKDNAEFHSKAGMSPKIVRKMAGDCCDWCANVAGEYNYPNVPRDVYRRHQRCRCTVDYVPNKGRKQNVWSKVWSDEVELDKIEKRKSVKYGEDIEKNTKSSTIKPKKDASKYVGKIIVDKDNQSIREWYYANVHDIPNQIDKTKPFEEQVKQAYSLRNKYKHEARVAMSDRETAERLEKKRPVKSFDELLKDKMQRKNMTMEEALRDILETASKTNENVDKEFGL